MLFLPELGILAVEYFFKNNVDVWSENSKDTKSEKTETFCFNHIDGSLNTQTVALNDIAINPPSSNQAIFCNTSNGGGGCFRFWTPYELDFGINR